MEFNIKRFGHLMRRDLITYQKPLVIGILGTGALLFALSSLIWITNVNEVRTMDSQYWSTWCMFISFIGGLLFTSIVFWEFRNAAGRIAILNIPASNFEKVITRWIYTLIIYPLVSLLLIYLVYLICSVLYTKVDWQWDNFKLWFNRLGVIYLTAHGFIFMCGIWFNKYVAPKAAILSFGSIIVFGIISAVMLYAVFNNMFEGPFMNKEIRIEPNKDFQSLVEQNYAPLVGRILNIVIPTFFLIVSYFKMKEKQV